MAYVKGLIIDNNNESMTNNGRDYSKFTIIFPGPRHGGNRTILGIKHIAADTEYTILLDDATLEALRDRISKYLESLEKEKPESFHRDYFR